MGNAATVSSDALTPYSMTLEAIDKMRDKYAFLDARKAYDPTRLAIADLRNHRVRIEGRRKELKAVHLEEGRRIDSAAKQLIGLLEEIEEPLKLSKQAVDDEKAREKREREEAARKVIEDALRAKREEEDERLRKEREAEESRLAEERERQRAEREALEEERAKMNAERDELAAKQRAVDDAVRKAEMEERERLAKIQAEQEERARTEREKAESEERRIAKLEREKRERELREEMAPDLEKVAKFAEQLSAIAAPDVKSKEASDALHNAIVCIERAVIDLHGFVKGGK